MFNKISAKYLRKLLFTFLWFIFFLKSVVGQTTGDNSANTTSNHTTTSANDKPFEELLKEILPGAVGGFIAFGGVALVIYVAIFYIKREKQRTRDLESGRREHKSSNDYETQVLKSEERSRHKQAETADKEGSEDEIEDVIEIDGHYTMVEFMSGSSKSAARNTADSKSKGATAESSDVEALYTKPKKKKKVNADHGSNPLYSRATKKGANGTRTKEKSVEDMYTKISGKKKHKESTVDELYTKSLKQQKNGASASATDTVDDLYTKPRKKRRQQGKEDVEEMYTKPQKKKKKAPVYMNSMKVEKVKKATKSTPAETEKDDKTRAMAAVVQDNELYTDCPDLDEC